MKRFPVIGMLLVFVMLASACATPLQTTVPPPTAVPSAAPIQSLTTPPQADTATSASSAKKQIVIGFSGAALLDDFQISLSKGIADEATELGVKLIHIENNNDPAKQAADIEDLLSQKVDMLLITAASADAIIPSIKKANQMGVPVMMVDQGTNGGDFVSLNGNDNYCMGYRGMEEVLKDVNGKGKVMHITGIAGTMIVNWNADAVKLALTKFPDAALVNQSFADWKADEAMADTEDVLTANPDLAGIYVHSESMTPGVIQALKARNLIGKVVVISGGLSPDSQTMLKNGEIQGAISWDSYNGGKQTLKSAYDYLVNGVVPPKWNPWIVYMNYADGRKIPLECPISGWSPFTLK